MTARLDILLALALAAALPLHAAAQKRPPAGKAAQAGKKLYCWNEGGQQICGDALPPSAVDRARTEINPRSGMRSGEVARALTAEERAAAAQAAKDAAVVADAEAAARRRDMAMVESYVTEDDLRRAYNERIALVEESLKTSTLGIANLQQSLLSLLRQAAEVELQAKPVRKPLVDNIQRQHADLLRLQAMAKKQEGDRAVLGDELEQALARYRAMKGAAEG